MRTTNHTNLDRSLTILLRQIFNLPIFGIATILVSPLILWQYILGALFGADRTLEGLSQFLALIPGRLGVVLRAAFYSRVLTRCDWTVFIGFGTLLTKVDTQLGRHAYIGPYCQLGWVTIGADTLLGPSVQIPSGQRSHTFDQLDIPIRNQRRDPSRIVVGKDCWVGTSCNVMADVGDQAVVGAGSVVTRPIPEKSVAVGVPAKVIKNRS